MNEALKNSATASARFHRIGFVDIAAQIVEILPELRVAAWIVLLQSGGLINSALMAMGIIDKPA